MDAFHEQFGVVSRTHAVYFPVVQIASPYNPKAVRILVDTHWGPKGWKKTNWMDISPEDFAYAVARGVMFQPVTMHHDEAVSRLLDFRIKSRPASLGEAFLYSLSTRDLAYRSALGS